MTSYIVASFHWPHDLGTWGFILALITLVLMYPVGILINVTTPMIKNCYAAGSKASLEERIDKLEEELKDLESEPVIDDIQERILWESKKTAVTVLYVFCMLIIVIFFAVECVPNPVKPQLFLYELVGLLLLAYHFWLMLRIRQQHDFTYRLSARGRKVIKATLEDLIRIGNYYDLQKRGTRLTAYVSTRQNEPQLASAMCEREAAFQG
jgi:hypothetical protein